jgi:hypothetical protein
MVYNWHVVISIPGQVFRALEALNEIESVADTCCPIRAAVSFHKGRQSIYRYPYLGPLVLAKWVTDDSQVWHKINSLISIYGILGGWPPRTVSDEAVSVMLTRIQEIELKGDVVEAPCQPGDIVRFTHLSFLRIIARCLWVDVKGQTAGLRLRMLGYDQIVAVPWEAILSGDNDTKRGAAVL